MTRYEVFNQKTGKVLFCGTKREAWSWLNAALYSARNLGRKSDICWRRA
jgi:hypothetical protein